MSKSAIFLTRPTANGNAVRIGISPDLELIQRASFATPERSVPITAATASVVWERVTLQSLDHLIKE